MAKETKKEKNDYEDAPDEKQVKKAKTRGDPIVSLEY